MALLNQGGLIGAMTAEGEVRTCDVCNLVDGDPTPKPTYYCGLCDAWMCVRCVPSIGRRAMAWMKRGMMKASK